VDWLWGRPLFAEELGAESSEARLRGIDRRDLPLEEAEPCEASEPRSVELAADMTCLSSAASLDRPRAIAGGNLRLDGGGGGGIRFALPL
jgi:hypothetical protein